MGKGEVVWTSHLPPSELWPLWREQEKCISWGQGWGSGSPNQVKAKTCTPLSVSSSNGVSDEKGEAPPDTQRQKSRSRGRSSHKERR